MNERERTAHAGERALVQYARASLSADPATIARLDRAMLAEIRESNALPWDGWPLPEPRLVVGYCTPETCTDPRCDNYPGPAA